MNILFLTLIDFKSYTEHNIYCDLLREFIKNGHEVYCVSPMERRTCLDTHFEENEHLLKLRIGNIQKTNIIEKGISTLRIESQLIMAIKKYFRDIKFDLILYSTPPITFAQVVHFAKKRDNAATYLLLKDIFLQNAVDLGMIKSTGLESLIYRYFRHEEKKLYSISDRIGCMSQANVDYVLLHNPEILAEKVGVCSNSIEVMSIKLNNDEKRLMRDKYGIPKDKMVFVYGGNLGKPQGIPFIIDCLKAQKQNTKAFFLLVGDGTEYSKLEAYFNKEKPTNMKLMRQLPKNDYNYMIAACDVGMIFLDHRFTIPNFPSRLLSYMQAKLPVIACTDPNTDIGKVIVDGGFGWWCESNNTAAFNEVIKGISSTDLALLGENAWNYLNEKYTAEKCFAEITVQKEVEAV